MSNNAPPDVTAQTEEKVRQVEEQLNFLRDAVSENNQIVGELLMRISDVLKDEDVVEATGPGTPELPLCELASRLRNVRRDIGCQSERIGFVLHRLEL